jgi:hypothetical protein
VKRLAADARSTGARRDPNIPQRNQVVTTFQHLDLWTAERANSPTDLFIPAERTNHCPV